MAEETIRLEDKRPDATEKFNFTNNYNKRLIEHIVVSAKKHGVDPFTAIAIGVQESGLGETGDRMNPFHAWSVRHTKSNIFEDPKYMSLSNERNRIGLELNKIEKAASHAFLATQGKVKIDPFNTGSQAKLDLINAKFDEVSDAWDKASKRMDERRQEFAQMHYGDVTDQAVGIMKEQFQYGRNVFGNDAEEELVIQGYNGYGWLPEGRQFYGANKRLHGAKDRPYGKRIINLRENMIKPNPEIQKIVNSVFQ